MPQSLPANGQGRGCPSTESTRRESGQDLKMVQMSASLWVKGMSPGRSWLALNHHGTASILYRICPAALLPTSTDLSGLTPRSPAGYLGHRGSYAQREVTIMNEGPSHLSFPSRTSLVHAQSITLPRGRQR